MVDKDFLRELNSAVEVELTVKGRKSGRDTSRPVWFVVDDKVMYLLPMHGSGTQWYRNLLANPEISVSVKQRKVTARSKPILDTEKVADIVNRFRSKHGTDDIKKYYDKLDVAVEIPL